MFQNVIDGALPIATVAVAGAIWLRQYLVQTALTKDAIEAQRVELERMRTDNAFWHERYEAQRTELERVLAELRQVRAELAVLRDVT